MFDLLYPAETAPVYPRPSVDRPGRPDLPPGEMLPLIEPSGIVYGQAPRTWCHGGSHALHPVVHLHLIDRMGSIFLQKRSLRKRICPGLWDSSVGGHIAYGEQALEALYREAAEEIGLREFNPSFLGTFVWESEREKELVIMYSFVGHPDLTVNELEIADGRWWPVQDIDKAVGTGLLTPDFEAEYAIVREKLLSLL
ncbi:MAG: NUDIX domain-containing protein [Bacteroidales bacterium]|nr:NUDIX domain-containing protein [Bacteroidales bacterium]